MPFELNENRGNLVILSVSGMLSYADWEFGQTAMCKALQGRSGLVVLVRAQGFTGWERTERWGTWASSSPTTKTWRASPSWTWRHFLRVSA
jgi:hypothetical protein